MAIFNALVVTAFLLLLAASTAVVGSMILLALFDWAFGKKSKLPITNEMTEQNTAIAESSEFGRTAIEAGRRGCQLKTQARVIGGVTSRAPAEAGVGDRDKLL